MTILKLRTPNQEDQAIKLLARKLTMIPLAAAEQLMVGSIETNPETIKIWVSAWVIAFQEIKTHDLVTSFLNGVTFNKKYHRACPSEMFTLAA